MDDMDVDDEEKGEKSLSPSAPILLSQKADLLSDARKKEKKEHLDLESGANSDDIEAMLGLGEGKKGKAAKQVKRANREEKISNSSKPLENEKLRSKASKSRGRNKIELNVEMTEEMKRQE